MAALHLNALRVFDSAARHLSFTRAARELSLTQGAVSYQVKRLEASLGFALFEREGRGVALTPEGQELWHTVRDALGAIAQTVERLQGAADASRITVGTTTYFASPPRWVQPFSVLPSKRSCHCSSAMSKS